MSTRRTRFLLRDAGLRLGLCLFSVFYFMSCSFKKPSAPSWNTQVNVPLINKVFTMADIADDESSLSIDSTGILTLNVDADLDDYFVGDQLHVKSLSQSVGVELGDFRISDPGAEFTSVALREIFAQADALDGQTVVVPSFSFDTTPKSLNPYDNFSYIVVKTGTIFLRVTNNLAVPLGSPLRLELRDAVQDTVITFTESSAQVAPGETRSFTVPLSGKRIPNQVSVKISGQSPGSGGQPVAVDASSSFDVEAEITGLSVSEAFAKIPGQVVNHEERFAIRDSVVIMDAQIESGTVDLTFGGSFPLDAKVVYSLPDFVNASGQALVDSFFVFRNTNATVHLDLSGYALRPEPAELGQQRVRMLATIKTVDTGNQFVLVRSQDDVRAEFNMTDLRFARVTGKLGETEIDVAQSEIDFNLPADIDSIFFQTARMELQINNGINFPATTELRIEGQNEAGAVAEMSVHEPILPALTPGVPRTSTIVLDQQNSNINEFISILPSLLRVAGKVKVGDSDWVGTVSKNDYINGTVKLTAPMSLRLPQQSVDSDPDKLTIDQDVRDKIIANLGPGKFVVQLGNHLPVGADVVFFFSQDSTTVFDNPILQVGAVRTEAAQVDSSGFVKGELATETTLDLSEQDLRTFLLSPIYVGIRVNTDGTAGRFVNIRGADYIQVKSFAQITVKINQD
ncbi:MAG: hypothetical protein D6743_11650 [Calditrichaeota bacterium]|nr:MAG: hypothetical protein D6743_11650 [Calditrichota bacterium]